MSKAGKLAFFGLGIAATVFTVGACASTTNTTDKNESAVVDRIRESISSAQPIPMLSFSIQRETMIGSYIAMSKRQPYYMIATNPGAGDNGQIPIVATAVVKGCVPATFQLTRPEEVIASQHDHGMVTGSQPEINGMYTGPTAATYCVGVDNTFFSLEHIVSFSTRPFSDAIRNQAAVDYTPTLKTLPDGTVIDTAKNNEVLFDGTSFTNDEEVPVDSPGTL